MELGIYHEFPVLPGRSQAECFAAGFDIVDASEEYGLDVMWLAELHFDKQRGLAASPLVLGTAIAARTERIRIGTSVQGLLRKAPTMSAMRLRPKAQDKNSTITVCNPYSGEKPMKTPMAKASAVRCGDSCRWRTCFSSDRNEGIVGMAAVDDAGYVKCS